MLPGRYSDETLQASWAGANALKLEQDESLESSKDQRIGLTCPWGGGPVSGLRCATKNVGFGGALEAS